MAAYLQEVGGERWLERLDRDQLGNDAQDLAEFAGKMCYRSWEPGLNPNVRKVRDDQAEYLENILSNSTARSSSTSASPSCCTTSRGFSPMSCPAPSGNGDLARVAAVRPAR